jgi:hypothetical protein
LAQHHVFSSKNLPFCEIKREKEKGIHWLRSVKLPL